MNISSNTKISALINENPAVIDVIASINKHFEKLRNPVLRKILASRITIAEAAKIGGCTVNDFFKKLQPLGFKIESDSTQSIRTGLNTNERPVFMLEVDPGNTIVLDVRSNLASGQDPFQKIMNTLSEMQEDSFLLIINTFEPLPLINILKRKGFEYYTEELQKDLVHTYFRKADKSNNIPVEHGQTLPNSVENFAEMIKVFKDSMKTIDVRNLEMPLPMVAILKELEVLPQGQALFVQHKKVPQFLLPELRERRFSWLIREDSEGDVKLLIFK